MKDITQFLKSQELSADLADTASALSELSLDEILLELSKLSETYLQSPWNRASFSPERGRLWRGSAELFVTMLGVSVKVDARAATPHATALALLLKCQETIQNLWSNVSSITIHDNL